ncbi:MAG: hypothetical protein ACLRTQ_05780 [Candidatus Borkfalkia sp.]
MDLFSKTYFWSGMGIWSSFSSRISSWTDPRLFVRAAHYRHALVARPVRHARVSLSSGIIPASRRLMWQNGIFGNEGL